MKSKDGSKDRGGLMKVSDIVARHRKRELPLVGEHKPIDELARAIEWHRHSRQLYVVDEQGLLLGNITLGRLVMYVFASSHGESMNPRHVMGLITCTCAGDLMTEGTITVRMDESVEEVLERMVDSRVDEVPVTDEKGRVVADLTMIDLLMAKR